MKREKALNEMGYILPEAAMPVANYTPGLISGSYAYVSGQLPLVNGKLTAEGRLGAELDIQQGYDAAAICALNGLAVLKSLLGDLDRIKRIVKITGFVSSAPDFTAQPKVVNGASDLLAKVFGEAGVHARSAVGAAGLPLGAAVEVELIVEIEG